MLTVLTVIGTRPEAIKLAPVVLALMRRPEHFRSLVCTTGQHRDMLDSALTLFSVPRHFDLEVMQPDQTLCSTTAAILQRLEPVLAKVRPDWVLVQGDTTTVMAAALAAFYHGVRVGHVEAGLRTFDKRQPFPEEVNRRIASVIADLHFAPTAQARQNLLNEGVSEHAIRVTGNTIVDALHLALRQPCDLEASVLSALPPDRRLVVVTAHRRENFGRGLEQICLALRDLVERFPDIHIVYPVHLNPNVQSVAHRLLSGVPSITLTPPLDYLPMVHLLKRATLVLTDSGGIQEEAPGLGKPVLVLRERTERPEGVEAGVVKLVGADRERIVEAAAQLLSDPAAYARMAQAVNPYGDGRAAERIAQALLEFT